MNDEITITVSKKQINLVIETVSRLFNFYPDSEASRSDVEKAIKSVSKAVKFSQKFSDEIYHKALGKK